MGLYDTIIVGKRDGQVKCWGQLMIVYHEGDSAPPINKHRNYSIKMGIDRDEGYVNVRSLFIVSWTDKPSEDIVYDRWGGEIEWVR